MKAFYNLQNRFAIAADRILLSCDKQNRKLFGNFMNAFRVVKPADQFSINYVLDKAINRLESTSSTLIAIKTSDGIVSLSSNDITYVEVFDHNLVYHTTKGVYDVRGRLSDVLKKLDPKRFIMCNRSFVVNLRYVQSACNDYLTIDGTKISISKSHRKEIMQHFSNFLGENV